MTRALAFVLVVMLAVGVLGACDDSAGADTAVLEVVAAESASGGSEYRFNVPDRVDGGWTRIALDNQGVEPHHAQVFRLDDGRTIDDLTAALATGEPEAALEVGTFVGGTGLVSPGTESRADAVLDLQPGEYAFLCFVPDADGAPHVAHGMVRPFEVGEVAEDAEPDPEGEVELADYAIQVPGEIDHDDTLEIVNTSAREPHEMVLVRVDETVAASDVVRALDERAPLPGIAVGGMQAIVPGARVRLQLDLEPGRYVLLCAIPSPDGRPHYHAGMVREVTVI